MFNSLFVVIIETDSPVSSISWLQIVLPIASDGTLIIGIKEVIDFGIPITIIQLKFKLLL